METDGPDPKWRYAWRIGNEAGNEELRLLRHDQVVPEGSLVGFGADTLGFPEWERIMNGWGTSLHATVATLSEMAAVGFGLPRSTFLDLIRNSSHLLAPTGSDLSRYNKVGTVLAGKLSGGI